MFDGITASTSKHPDKLQKPKIKDHMTEYCLPTNNGQSKRILILPTRVWTHENFSIASNGQMQIKRSKWFNFTFSKRRQRWRRLLSVYFF